MGAAMRAHASAPFGASYISPLGFSLVYVPAFVTRNGFGIRSALSQPVFEKLLLHNLAHYRSVSCHFATTLAGIRQTEAGVDLEVEIAGGERRTLRAGYVLACDGAHSFVRRSLQIPFDGRRIDEPHLVLDLAEFPDQSPFSRFFCNPQRPMNSVPAPYGGRRLEFMLSPGDDPEVMLADAKILELVDRHSPYEARDVKIIRRAVYGFSERIAGRLQDGRVFLLGDAAHIMPPFGAQGMNTGARDAANIAWKLAAVVRGELPSTILASYEPERRSQIEQIVAYSVRIGRLANIRSRAIALVRDAFFAVTRLVPPARRYFREMRYMPKPHIAAGLVVPDAAGLAGRIFPRLPALDDEQQAAFAIVAVDTTPQALERAAQHRLWASIPVITRAISSAALEAREGAFVEPYAGHIVVVRPDRYVAVCANENGLERDLNRFASQLGIGGS